MDTTLHYLFDVIKPNVGFRYIKNQSMKNLLRGTLSMGAVFLYSVISIAQVPTLGTAAGFVLFTGTGAVTNSGISQVTGNVGTNSGSSTGFGNVNGVMHDNDGATLQAAADLQIAYNQLNSAIPTFFPAPLLGNGDTLLAGVYKISAVTTLSGVLTLNANNNPNAVFIFQIEAAFSTSASSKIKLINGAQACNVFWKVEGLVSVGPASFFRGTIVAHNAAIALTTNDTLEGRALSTTGAVTLNGTLAYLPTGCGSVLLTGPAAPPLGPLTCFAILSGNGSVTNSGISYIIGDVGTNVGLTVGYQASNVTGTIHPIPDTATTAAAAALLVTYTYLNTLPTDIQLLYPAQFGSNLVLTPHTYLMNAATFLTGTVFLNGENNPNAVFVIKINGALNTSTFSRVVLTNGTQAKNVYWKVDGAVTINDYSIFCGTIVCNNGAVNLNTGVTLNGRAFTTNGALATAGVTTTMVSGANCSAPLPLTWVYFNGKSMQKTVSLTWATANELNNSFFTLEKSKDGNTFSVLATIPAAINNGGGQYQYAYTDGQPTANGFYRISQTDKDGRKNYYKTIKISLDGKQLVQVQTYLQPGAIQVKIAGAQAGAASIVLYNLEGKKLLVKTIQLSAETTNYMIEKPMTNGLYLLSIESQDKKIYSGKIMVL